MNEDLSLCNQPHGLIHSRLLSEGCLTPGQNSMQFAAQFSLRTNSFGNKQHLRIPKHQFRMRAKPAGLGRQTRHDGGPIISARNIIQTKHNNTYINKEITNIKSQAPARLLKIISLFPVCAEDVARVMSPASIAESPRSSPGMRPDPRYAAETPCASPAPRAVAPE